MRIWKPLAEQGYDRSQYNLGLMYHNGYGVLQDYIYAHMWLNISASFGSKNGVKVRDIIEKEMTPIDILTAQKLAREYLKNKYKGC